MTKTALADEVKCYYEKRGLTWPTFEQAMAFLVTEVGEAYEAWLARFEWKRNHPEEKTLVLDNAIVVELADVVMMAIVAGIVSPDSSCDVIGTLRSKMQYYLQEEIDGQN